ncbi:MULTISPECIES: hypothetical protein [unclassified Streptomyces]|uniref:hypothetical protein n=1 Tax=unclassified Streptomyces TaxID=2593676 RepID=UPI00088B3C87|nr:MULTISPECIES: hypothetical protein [unclassified Streptomyces]PBC72293.1 hypothetical protein BX261_7377 [Streptomyces sp. 2321.6]SDR62276.1 hypothetical protein SAMN05216511_7326 [Streptomyces sp. KS_16]SEE51542.1 hypothetical protein SAMN05428940_7375 [Streptomyces sp. 2133.1]SNC77797.1 hypothetical protein SAMN06272741_7213 [Streptomyces sp. 2114.4]
MDTTRYSVTLTRPGYTTIALGPYSIRGVADLTAWNLTHHLRDQADAQVDVEPHDETLEHLPELPTTPQELATVLANEPATTDRLDIYARLAAQVGGPESRKLLADAYMRCAVALWPEIAG